MFADAGCLSVRTYIQSGNVIFETPGEAAKIAEVVTAKIEKTFGYRVPMILRTSEQLLNTIRGNPFLKAGADEKALHVYFLAHSPEHRRDHRIGSNPLRARRISRARPGDLSASSQRHGAHQIDQRLFRFQALHHLYGEKLGDRAETLGDDASQIDRGTKARRKVSKVANDARSPAGAAMACRNIPGSWSPLLPFSGSESAQTQRFLALPTRCLLRPPPYQSSARLVRIEETTPNWVMSVISTDDFRFWEDRPDLFDKTVPYRRDIATLTYAGVPDQVFAVRTSAQLFSLLGVRPSLGRTLADADDLPSSRQFGRDQRPVVEAHVRRRPARDRPHHHILRRSLHHRGRDAAGIRVSVIAGGDVDSAAPERRLHWGAGSGGAVERGRYRRSGSRRNARSWRASSSSAIHRRKPGCAFRSPHGARN